MTEDASAGRLYIEAVADTTGFARDAQRKINAEMRAVRARIKAEIDTGTVKAQAQKAAQQATRAAKVKVQATVDPRGLNQAVRAAANSASSAAIIKLRMTIDPRGLTQAVRAAAKNASSAAVIRVRVEADTTNLIAETVAAAKAASAAARSEVQVDADTSRARAEINSIGDTEATVEVDADTAGAEAQIEGMRRRQSGKPVNVPAQASGLDKLGKQIMAVSKLPMMAGGIYMIGTAAVQAAGGLFAMGSAASQAIGVVGALPSLLGTAAQGIGSLVIGFSGIGGALEALGKTEQAQAEATKASGEERAAAQQRVADAHQAVRDAARGVTEAERGVASAQRAAADAARAIEDAHRAVAEARRGVGDAIRAHRDAVRGVADAQRAEVAAARAVEDAQRAVADAHQAVRDAAQTHRDAVRGVTDAQRAEVDAARALDDAQRAVGQTRREVAEETRDAAEAVRDGVEAVDDAERNVAQTQQGVLAAQEALNQARIDAREHIRDINMELRHSVTTEQEAQLALRQARERLADMLADPTATKTEVIEARVGVSGAEDDLERIRESNGDLRKQVREANREGVAGQDNVIAAQEGVTEAVEAHSDAVEAQRDAVESLRDAQANQNRVATNGARRIADAQRAVADAHRGVRDAARGVRDAYRAVADAARGLADARRGVGDALRGVEDAELGVTEASRNTRDALRNVRDAERGIGDARRGVGEALRGVEDAERNYADAQRGVADARRGVRDAERNLADARRTLSQATKDAKQPNAALAAALAAQSDAFDKLSPAGKKFARYLYSLKPRMIEFRNAVQQSLLPPLQKGIKAAMPLLDTLQTGMVDSAGIVGRFGQRLGKLFGSKAFNKDVALIMDSNNDALGRFSNAGLDLVFVFSKIAVAARPLVKRFSQWVEKLAQSWRESVNSRKEGENLRQFFVKAGNVAARLSRIVGNLVGALFGMGKAAGPAGNDLLKSFEKVTAKWNTWANSDEGQKRMGKFFQATKPVTRELGKLVSNLVEMIVKLGEAGGGPLVWFLKGINAILNAVNWLLNVPFVGKVAGWAFTIMGVAGALGFVAGYLMTFGKRLGNLVSVLRTVGGWLLKLWRFLRIGRLLMMAWTGIVWAFNAAMAANPVVLVVLAIAALVAGLIWAYKKFEGFRNVVDSVVDAVVGAFKWLWNALFGHSIITDIVDAFKKAWNAIARVVRWLWRSVIKPVFNALKRFFNNVVAPVFTWLWKNVVKRVFKLIGAYIGLWWKGVKAIFGVLKWYFKNVLAPVWSWIWRKVVKPVMEWIGEKVRKIWKDWIKPAFQALWRFFKDDLGPVFRWLWNRVVKPVMEWIGEKVRKIWQDWLKPAFNAIWDFLKDDLGPAFRWLWNRVVKPVMEWIGEKVRKIWRDWLKPALKALWSFIKDDLGPTFKWLYNRVVKPVMEWIRDKIQNIWRDGIKPIFVALKDFIRDTVAPAFRRGIRALGNIWNRLKRLAAVPVNFVIDTVYNDGIRKLVNKVWGFFSDNDEVLPELAKVDWGASDGGVVPTPGGNGGRTAPGVQAARGAVLPGWTPGRDVHEFASPTGGRLALSGGEAVMRPEFTRGVGAEWVHRMNDVARRRGVAGVRRTVSLLGQHAVGGILRLARGGIVNPTRRISVHGEPLTRISAAQLALAEKLGKIPISVMQGSWQPYTDYSGSSHTGAGGVADTGPGSFNAQKWLRRVGFAAWARNIPGAATAGTGAHVHSVSRIDPTTRDHAQLSSWSRNEDGLGGRDYGPNPRVLPNLREHLAQFGRISLSGGGGGDGGGGGLPWWAEKLLSSVTDWIKDKIGDIPGAKTGMGELMVAGANKMLDRAVAWVTEKFGGGGGGAAYSGPTSGNVKRFTDIVEQVLTKLRLPTSAVSAVLHRMDQESSGRVGIVNDWDTNAAMGTPSVGLMQVIRGTYQAFKANNDRGPFKHGVSIDPYSNIFAGVNYAANDPKYAGRSLTSVMMQDGGYDNGGWLMPGMGGYVNATGRPEAVLDPVESDAFLLLARVAAELRAGSRAPDRAGAMAALVEHLEVNVADRRDLPSALEQVDVKLRKIRRGGVYARRTA